MRVLKCGMVLVAIGFLASRGARSAPGTEGVQIEWLLNFDQAPSSERFEKYTPSLDAGEIAPKGAAMRVVNNSGRMGIRRLPDGRRVLQLDGSGNRDDGLLFEHLVDGKPSRIFEAVVALDAKETGQFRTIIASNDWEMRPPGQIVALGIDDRKRATVELRALDAYDHYPVTEELDSMHRFVRGKTELPTDGRFFHVATVYDHSKQALYLYVDGELVRSTVLEARENEFTILRGVGISNWAWIRRPDRGFTGAIDGVAESTFTGEFRPAFFRLLKADGLPPPRPAVHRKISLDLPEPIARLPSVSTARYTVHEPGGWDEPTYHHGPMITHWRGEYTIAWHAAQRGENTWPVRGMLTRSRDLRTWSAAQEFDFTPRYLHPRKDRLYLWGGNSRVTSTRDGLHWDEFPANSLQAIGNSGDGDIFVAGSSLPYAPLSHPRWTYLASEIREAAAGHPLVRLSDRRLMAPVNLAPRTRQELLESRWICAPTTVDLSGMSDWVGGKIDASACPNVGEGSGWEGPDGVFHYAARCGPRVWHASSADRGRTWTPLLPQPAFTNAPGHKVFGRFPDGSNWYVGNPIPGSRAQLVVATSKNGWNFQGAGLVRSEPVTPRFPSPRKNFLPGYEHPTAIYHDGKLIVTYSVARERIEVSVVDAADLVRGKPDADPTGPQLEWLLNFEHTADPVAKTYTPDPKNGEVAPAGNGIRVFNESGKLRFAKSADGRGVLALDGREGLLFEHRSTRHPSRILELVVAPAAGLDAGTRLLSLNDWDHRPPGQIAYLGIGGGSTDGGYRGTPIIKLVPTTGIFTNFPSPRHAFLRGPEKIPTDGSFRHVALVYEHETQSLYLYYDGELAKALNVDFTGRPFPIFRALGISNQAADGDPGRGFRGLINAAVESSFGGRFSPQYFRLIDVDDPAPPPVPHNRRLRLYAPLASAEYPNRGGPAPAMGRELERHLPKLPSTRHVVHRPESWEDAVYHHGAILSAWKGKIYLTWHQGGRGEYTAFTSAPVYASSDGETWEHEHDLPAVAPRTMHATDDRLYIWAGGIHYTEDGESWHKLEKFPPNHELRSSNRNFARLRDGRLMHTELLRSKNAAEGARGLWKPALTTHDPTAFTGWSGGTVDMSGCPDPGEPGGYEGPDGVLHYIARCGPRIWHAYSEDGGETWSMLVQQRDFTDSPSNKQFGVFPDRSVWYIGNPVPGNREHLVLSISRDGWNFDESHLVRWEPYTPRFPAPHKHERPGYEYPAATYHEGKLYIAYSPWREAMEVSIVNVVGLGLIKIQEK